jgi:hypothetical protein
MTQRCGNKATHMLTFVIPETPLTRYESSEMFFVCQQHLKKVLQNANSDSQKVQKVAQRYGYSSDIQLSETQLTDELLEKFSRINSMKHSKDVSPVELPSIPFEWFTQCWFHSQSSYTMPHKTAMWARDWEMAIMAGLV